MSNQRIKNFASVSITSGANKEIGALGAGDYLYTEMDGFSVVAIDIQSAGAGVGTITFNMGNGYSDSEVLTAATSGVYLLYGCTSIKITASVATIVATVKLCEFV